MQQGVYFRVRKTEGRDFCLLDVKLKAVVNKPNQEPSPSIRLDECSATVMSWLIVFTLQHHSAISQHC